MRQQTVTGVIVARIAVVCYSHSILRRVLWYIVSIDITAAFHPLLCAFP